MASFISKGGKWYPANERAANQDTGEVYEGPDREAKRLIKELGGDDADHIGIEARRDPENIARARQLGMTIDEFLKINEPLTEEQKKVEEAKESTVVTHIKPKPKRGVRSGGGAFGEIKL